MVVIFMTALCLVIVLLCETGYHLNDYWPQRSDFCVISCWF